MNRPYIVRIALFTVVTLIGASFGVVRAAEPAILPGPENGGLRLQFSVTAKPRIAGFEVQLDLLNVTQDRITLQTAWGSNDDGDVQEYLKTVAELETIPLFAPEHGATGALEERTEPQRTLALQAGETLSLRWQTSERRLKGNPSERVFSILSPNPQLDEPGLYSVRVLLDVPATSGTVRLRSNEQLVSIGGSLKTPKPTAARIVSVTRHRQSARIDLGKLDQVAPGDQFEFVSKTSSWRLMIADTYLRSSEGKLELISSELGDDPPAVGEFVTRVKKAVATK